MTSPTFFATMGTFGCARVLSRIRAANSSYNSDVLFRVRRKRARLSLYIRSFKVLKASYMLNQSLNLLSFNTATEPISLQIDRSLVFFLKVLLGLRYAAY